MVMALIVLQWPTGYSAIEWFANQLTSFLNFSRFGAEFVFGETSQHPFAMQVLIYYIDLYLS